ncbi:hypothetical protein EMPS_09908 [Entomortierella parvispora]|uniref:Uncharacterized protein n=1 Tax=Entomortierella parvispora TaxID=205924 RepID=A0A9P3HIW4_9FUNG|nr:hypothetical protein EMPS_09908 [Entomortierella parvispora]
MSSDEISETIEKEFQARAHIASMVGNVSRQEKAISNQQTITVEEILQHRDLRVKGKPPRSRINNTPRVTTIAHGNNDFIMIQHIQLTLIGSLGGTQMA